MTGALAALKAVPLWLVLVLAAGGFIWWQHGQIEKAQAATASLADEVQHCQQARNNLEALANEQGKALGDLQLAAQKRQVQAEQAIAGAHAEAQADYQAANRLQQERAGGDQRAAATSIIDKELGL